jgi:hypothetical protein
MAVPYFIVEPLPALHMEIRKVLNERRKVAVVLRPEDHAPVMRQ